MIIKRMCVLLARLIFIVKFDPLRLIITKYDLRVIAKIHGFVL